MSLLDKINKEIERTEATIKVFEAPSDIAMSEYQKGWNYGTLTAWRRILVALQEIRKLTPIPAYIDQWIVCPECRADFDLDPETPEFILDTDGYYIWLGPSACPDCGQALDLTALNVPDKDSTFGLPDVAVDLLRDFITEDSTP